MSVTEYDLPAKAVKPTAWRRRRALLTCGFLALAFALTACGSSAKPAPRVTPPTTITSAAQSTTAQSTAPSSESASDLTGTWNGTTQSSAGQDVIDLTVVFTQQGNTLSGSITTDSSCFRGGTVSGTNNGTAVDFVAVNASQKMTFKASSRGHQLDGTYEAVTSCPNDSGTFKLTGPS